MGLGDFYRSQVPEGVRDVANATLAGAGIGAFTGGAAAVARRFSLAVPGVAAHGQPHQAQHQSREQARRSGYQYHSGQQYAHGQHHARHSGTFYR